MNSSKATENKGKPTGVKDGSDLEDLEHDLISALRELEGEELEDFQQTNNNDDDDDDDDEEGGIDLEEEEGSDEEGTPKKRKNQKKKNGKPGSTATTFKKPAAKKAGRAKKKLEEENPDTDAASNSPQPPPPQQQSNVTATPPQLPKMPASGPGSRVLETDLAQARLWIKDLVAHAEEALLSSESLAEVKSNRVVSAYAKVLREAVLTVSNLEKRYEEAHRVFVAYSFEARRTETYGDRRGAGAYTSMSK